MNDVAQAIEEVRAEIAAASGEFFPDLFTLRVPGGSIADGFGGTTDASSVEYTNIPGKIEPLGRADQTIGGAQITNQTHRITVGATVITRAIRSHYQIIRQAQGAQAAEIYENPVALLGSMDVFMKVAVALSL